MSTENTKTTGMSPELLHRYIEMRRKIDIEANTIYSITSMLALLETSGDDRTEIDPVAFGKINQMLNKNILTIWEILDDFIYLVHAQSELTRLKKK